jgi:hypothetical protein
LSSSSSVATPGTPDYRHFSSLDQTARQYGATDAQINAVAKSIGTLGLQFAADPTRLLARVTGSTIQWQMALGAPLSARPGTASSPFTTYRLPAATALVDSSERTAGRPPIGLANGWFYHAATTRPSTFFDITSGNNDIAGVGCCQAAADYDLASGLGVPNWATLPAALPTTE